MCVHVQRQQVVFTQNLTWVYGSHTVFDGHGISLSSVYR